MDLTFETLIGLMVVFVLMGLGLTAWLIHSVRQRQRKRRQATGKDKPIEQASAPLPDTPAEPVAAMSPAMEQPELSHQPSPVSSPAPPPARTHTPAPEPGDVSLMQVWRDRDGFLVVEVDGQRYRRLFDIRDGKVGQRVLDTINRLVAFSKGQESRVPLPPSSQPLQDAAPSSALTFTPPAGEVIEEQSQAFFDELQQQAQAQPKKSRITTDPVPFRRRSKAKEGLISLNLAAEIDQLLQIRVKASPELSQRFIHVRSVPEGGLRFRVDDVRYDGIDEIPDPQIQAVIRAAIAEWEAKR